MFVCFFILKQNCNLKVNLNWVIFLDTWEILYLPHVWFIDEEKRNQELIKNVISIFNHWRLHISLLTEYLYFCYLSNIYCVPPTHNHSALNYKQIMKLCKTLILSSSGWQCIIEKYKYKIFCYWKHIKWSLRICFQRGRDRLERENYFLSNLQKNWVKVPRVPINPLT